MPYDPPKFHKSVLSIRIQAVRNLLFLLCLMAPSIAQSQETLKATAETKYIIGGIDDYEIIMGRVVVEKSVTPHVIAIGYLRIDAPNSHVAVKAKDSNFEPVEIVKSQSAGVYEYLILASGRIFIDAISVDKTTGALHWEDFAITIGKTPDPDPEPEPDPDPEPEPDDLSVQVKLWALKVNDPITAKAMANAYSGITKSLERGSIAPSEAWSIMSSELDLAIKSTGTTKDWSGFRANVAGVINAGLRRGLLKTSPEIERLLKTVEKGLLDSIQG